MNISRLWIGIALLGLVCAAGCKKDGEGGEKEDSAKAAASGGVDARAATELLGKQANRIPAGADGVGVLEVGPILKRMLGAGAFGIIPPVKDPDAFQKDLGDVYKRFVGFDGTKVDYVVGFAVIEKKMAGAIVAGDFGEVNLPGETEEVGGLKALRMEGELYLAPTKGALLIGNKAAIEAMTGDGDKLAGTDKYKAHVAALEKGGAGLLAVSVAIPGELRDMALKGSPLEGLNVTHVYGVMGNKLAVLIQGDQSAVDQIKGFVDMGMGAARAFMANLEGKIDKTDNFEEALAGVAAKHIGAALLEIPQIEKGDGTLSVAVDMPAGAIGSGGIETMWLMGVMSAVAIPAFIKYTRRAKTVEAIDQLDKIYKSAANYYTSPRVARGTGMKLPCQFPESQSMTPNVNNRACCGGEHDSNFNDRCDVNVSLWTTPTWSALNFQMNDEHYFGYEFKSSGTLADAKFTAAAYADLDCDGILSTFERYGYGDPSASHAECSMKGSSAFYKHQETE